MPDPRRERTRRRLLDAGARLIAARGASGLRIADITREADVAVGSFQNHFESKDDLIEAVVREALQALAAEIIDTGSDEERGGVRSDGDDAARSDGDDGDRAGSEGDGGHAAATAETAIAALRRFVRLAYEDPEFCRVLVNLHHRDDLFLDAIRPYAQTALRRAAEAGVFVIDDLDVAVTSIVAGALAVIKRILDGEIGPGADTALARAALLGFQVSLVEADRIATLLLPPSRLTDRSAVSPTLP